MNPKLRIAKTAVRDVTEAAKWYGQQEENLDERFLGVFYARLEKIAENPELAREIGFKGTRKSMISGWPYSIFYRCRDEQVRVIAVIHTSRDPGFISRRLR